MPDAIEFRLVDAFAASPYSGNVAGVVFDADSLTDKQMQAIASEFNASETTFILKPTTKDAGVRFRWFTPGCEVDFCGHATLGGVHALLDAGRFAHALKEPGTVLPIETKSGSLEIRIERRDPDKPYTIWLDTPHNDPKPDPVVVPQVCRYLNIQEDAIDPAIPAIRTHDDDIIIAVKTLQTLLEMQPPMADLARYCTKQRLRGVLVTTRNVLSAATIVQSRFFAPAAGVDEDPVTGSVHGPLGLHLVKSGIVNIRQGRVDFLCAQAKAGGRAGIVNVVVTRSSGGTYHVRVGGSCIVTAAGTLQVLPKEK